MDSLSETVQLQSSKQLWMFRSIEILYGKYVSVKLCPLGLVEGQGNVILTLIWFVFLPHAIVKDR